MTTLENLENFVCDKARGIVGELAEGGVVIAPDLLARIIGDSVLEVLNLPRDRASRAIVTGYALPVVLEKFPGRVN